jgi:hypothetical protein
LISLSVHNSESLNSSLSLKTLSLKSNASLIAFVLPLNSLDNFFHQFLIIEALGMLNVLIHFTLNKPKSSIFFKSSITFLTNSGAFSGL